VKPILILLASVMLLGCASSQSAVDRFSGSWTMHGTEYLTMLVLREDGTCSLYKNIGGPHASTWEGRWKIEETHLMILDIQGNPVSVAHFTGRAEIVVYLFTQAYRFHRYGSGAVTGDF
jgi:hypothetical protein